MTKQKPQQSKVTETIPEFKWLFVAKFADGTVIEQTQEGEIGHSMMADVTEKQKTSKLVIFGLHDKGVNSVLVSLESGLFQVNDIWVQLHNQYFDPLKYKLELVYFHETAQQITLNAKTREVLENSHTFGRYFIGWKTKVNGKNKQVTLAVG